MKRYATILTQMLDWFSSRMSIDRLAYYLVADFLPVNPSTKVNMIKKTANASRKTVTHFDKSIILIPIIATTQIMINVNFINSLFIIPFLPLCRFTFPDG